MAPNTRYRSWSLSRSTSKASDVPEAAPRQRLHLAGDRQLGQSQSGAEGPGVSSDGLDCFAAVSSGLHTHAQGCRRAQALRSARFQVGQHNARQSERVGMEAVLTCVVTVVGQARPDFPCSPAAVSSHGEMHWHMRGVCVEIRPRKQGATMMLSFIQGHQSNMVTSPKCRSTSYVGAIFWSILKTT